MAKRRQHKAVQYTTQPAGTETITRNYIVMLCYYYVISTYIESTDSTIMHSSRCDQTLVWCDIHRYGAGNSCNSNINKNYIAEIAFIKQLLLTVHSIDTY